MDVPVPQKRQEIVESTQLVPEERSQDKVVQE